MYLLISLDIFHKFRYGLAKVPMNVLPMGMKFLISHFCLLHDEHLKLQIFLLRSGHDLRLK
jgi:hypothetical protein